MVVVGRLKYPSKEMRVYDGIGVKRGEREKEVDTCMCVLGFSDQVMQLSS